MSLEQRCKAVYRETRDFYAGIEPWLGDRAYGFKILYGPPRLAPPVLFIGYQPGGKEKEPGEQDCWPDRIDYAVKRWPLAKKLRQVFSLDELDQCNGFNALFVRARNMAEYRKLDCDVLEKIDAHCRPRVADFVAWMRPKLIVIIGVATGEILGLAERDPVLPTIRRGSFAGAPAIAVPHLVSAHLTREQREAVKARLRALAFPGVTLGER
jgi:hypothetical protein